MSFEPAKIPTTPAADHPRAGEREFPCSRCGAKLKYLPGTAELTCPYCATKNTISTDAPPVEEKDFAGTLESLERDAEHVERVEVECRGCSAHVQMAPNVSSSNCPFCGTPIVATGKSVKLLKPGAVLPFGLSESKARESFRAWIGKRWFAPRELKRSARIDAGVQGVYVPYWTYDCRATTQYTGQRGDDYWDTETYTAMENGRPVVRTRRVVRTRWTPAAGTVTDAFDDLLVCASGSVPAKSLDELEPWDLKALVPYTDEYLAGFKAETYAVTLKDGFSAAQNLMQPEIDRTICGDIGGDHQRISSKRSRYDQITFKHVLLPVWMCAYRWNNKAYQILINARTGEVRGARPYSGWKIAMFVVAIVAAVAVIAVVVRVFGS